MTKTPKRLALLLVAVLLSLGGLQLRHVFVSAAPDDVIINEIMYHPLSDLPIDDYLELYNRTNAPIDLEGWCFTAGITGCFTAGMSIAAHGYVLVSPDVVQTSTTYGGATAIMAYTGSLSNGGETVTLTDDSLAVVDSVSYLDQAPWPITPDGSGPSLELKDPDSDNSSPSNWGASLGDPTPGQSNSYIGLALPEVSAVTDPNDTVANEAVTINATVTNADTVSLIYRVGFGAEQTLAMNDDGNSDDDLAGDSVFGASIPGQSAGELVRFRVEASNGDGDTFSPSVDNSMENHGYVILDPGVTSAAPILNWFIEEDDFTEIQDPGSSQGVPAVIAIGNDVFDSATARLKGDVTRNWVKKSYKFNLPDGYQISVPGSNSRPINEFHVNSDLSSATLALTPTVWWAIEQAGFSVPQVTPVRIERNGEFEGMYIFIDKYKDEWLDATGYRDGELYEDSSGVDFGADNLDNLVDWRTNMTRDRHTPGQLDYVIDNVDIPKVLNYMAVPALIGSYDNYSYWNEFQHKSNATDRWSMLFWDLDLSFDPAMYASPASQTQINGGHMNKGDDMAYTTTGVYIHPELRSLYFRRLRTLVDTIYANDAIMNKYEEFADLYAADMEAELVKWPLSSQNGRFERSRDEAALRSLKTLLLNYLPQPWTIPPSQTDDDRQSVIIEDAEESSVNANEFIKLTNSADTAVDLSNWTIDELDYTLPAGSVVPANGSIYLLRSDKAYRDTHDSVLVAGQFSSDLTDLGERELTLKTDTGATIDVFNY